MTVSVGHGSVTPLDQPAPALDELLPPLESVELPQGVLQALAPWVPQPHLSIKRLPAVPAFDLAQVPTATAHSVRERIAGDQRRMLPGLPEMAGTIRLPARPPVTQLSTGVTEAECAHFPTEASLVMVHAASARPTLVAAELSPMRTPSLPATPRMPIDSAPARLAAAAADLAQVPAASGHSVEEKVAGDSQRMLPILPQTEGATLLPAGPPETPPLTQLSTGVTEAECEHFPVQASLVMVRAATARPTLVAAELPPIRMPSLPASLQKPIDSAPANQPGEGLRVPFDNGRISGTLLITGNESTQGMLVTPDKNVLLEQLREPFSRLDQPAWRLSERADDRDHGHRRAHADEPEDEPEQSR
ncbi:hypothetical protein DM813_25305 [Pseudomonas alkylphenolica]|uniref:Uncharacterized protein n=1 Tax=Pseudomonas alkylphenolica TaxID=237609 RepID=A0A443ZGQ4_9PSED|nr:hypothetical protein [Pseudomonas alkylphenolica]RWU17990.1 hypothetical protein DM813_25305 [Pseudomonas alkylphenolica]